MPSALVLISPAAGRGGNAARRDRLAVAITAALKERGLTADFPSTSSADEAARLLRTAKASGYELAVMAGGDGTVRLGVNALAGGECRWASCRWVRAICSRPRSEFRAIQWSRRNASRQRSRSRSIAG